MAEISVVIPTRDRLALLRRNGLRSALEQEDVDHEVIVVDDGSTNGTAAYLASLREPRLRVVRRDNPGGMAASRNAGIAAVETEWVAFLDDDDLWAPRKLRVQLDEAERSRADLVYAGAVAVDDRGTVLYELVLPDPHEVREKLRRACVVPAGASNVIVRTELVRAVGGFDESLPTVADWDLWLSLADRGTFACCPEILVGYVLHSQNSHALDNSMTEVDELVRKHAAASPPRAVTPDRLGYARWMAAQRSRAGLHRAAAAIYLRTAVAHRSPGSLLRAADALTGKRLSRTLRGSDRGRLPSAPAPDWLRRFAA